MKAISKLLTILVAAALLLSLFTGALAANEPYTYTVRIFPGNNGTANTGDCLVMSGIEAGTRITIGMPDSSHITLGNGTITLDDSSKYFIRGVRVSGDDALASMMSFTVNQDMDFVVAYGMRGNAVEYTIHYVERGTGTVLLDPVTFYGSAGDRPVVAYRHVDGYRPLYYNITGTLAEGGNDWTFEYVAEAAETTPTPAPTPTTTPAPTPTEPGGEEPGGTEPGGTEPGGEEPGGTEPGGTEPGGNEPGGTEPGGTEPGGNEPGGTEPGGTEPGGTDNGEPGDILDIDVPQAGPGSEENWLRDFFKGLSNGEKLSPGAVAGIAGGGAAVIGVALWLILRKKKKS